MASDERFDIINADLFLPYRPGTGSLYNLGHYQTVAERLNPDGVFAQWLPLYQITSDEFGVIARTMLEAFEQLTMWRNNFEPGGEKLALIGQMQKGPIALPPGGDAEFMRRAIDGLQRVGVSPDMVRVEPESVAFYYAGNLSAADELFRDYPVNTDDRPVIEYQTPRGFREVAAHDEVIWCVGPKFIDWVERIFEAAPLQSDPVWQGLPDELLHQARAGEAFHQAMVAGAMGRDAAR